MYILNSSEKEIINSNFVERFCISDKEDAALIIASYNNVRPPVTIARYKNTKEAKAALGELFAALAGGQTHFFMSDSLLYGEETIKEDARTRRRGGS